MSLISLLPVKAQDMGCGTCADFGTYRQGNETAIINHYFNCPANNCNDAGGPYNMIGGSNSDIGLNGDFRNSFTYGEDNQLVNTTGNPGVAIGLGRQLDLNAPSNYAIGENITLNNGLAIGIGGGHTINSSSAIAIGGRIDLNNQSNYAFGGGITTNNNRTIAIGFNDQSTNTNLSDAGQNSITLGVEAQNVFNILLNSNNNPVTGIGTTSPGTDKLRIVGNGIGTNAALNVQNSNNDNRLKVRNDGWTGFSADPSAPFFFTETSNSPFQSGSDGKANIVQNYAAFPNFKNVGPFNNDDSAKWLALGERPPASSTNNDDQVAYGLANVWQNNAANFVLLDQDPGTSGQTAEKDLAITFQDVWNQSNSSALTDPANAGNRIRFLFRNSNDIDDNNSTFELMSLEPTGEVAVGDYSDNSVSPDASRLEVKTESACNSCSNPETIMEVLRNKNPSNTGGDPVFTVRDNNFVGVNTSTKMMGFSDIFQVDGDGRSFGWNTFSDARMKKNIDSIKDPLSKIGKIRGVKYNFKQNRYPNLNCPKGRQAGVIAQEIKKVLPEAVTMPKGENGLYGVNYDAIIPLLIETNKAQQKQIEKLKKKTESLKSLRNKVEKLQQQIEQIQNKEGAKRFKRSGDQTLNQKTVTIGDDNQTKAMLLQNRPNPYSDKTTIPYYLPENFSEASMLITDIKGQLVKRVPLEQSGKGELTLRTESLNAGQYIYSLIVDGRKVQSRKMVVNQ